MRSDKVFDLVVFALITLLGLGSAYICFGILSSQAGGHAGPYTVGGAIAGALVSWSVLLSVYLQLRGSSNELLDLRKQNKELQGKLLRGAPRPQGFDIEVDERQRIVLARPKDWAPKGGIIFELELPEDKMRPTDSFAATFRCSFIPFEKQVTQTAAKFYENQIKQLKDAVSGGLVQSYTQEVMRLGGEAESVECLKVIANQVARVEIKIDPETGLCQRNWNPITWSEFVGQISDCWPERLVVEAACKVIVYGVGFHKDAVCYVNKKKRQTLVEKSWQLEVTIEPEDVAAPGVLELHVENPHAKGRPSNTRLLMVIESHLDYPSTSAPPRRCRRRSAASRRSAGGHGCKGACSQCTGGVRAAAANRSRAARQARRAPHCV